MKTRKYEIVLRRAAVPCLSLDSVAACAGMHPGMIELLMEYGLVQPLQTEYGEDLVFDVSVVPRLKRIERLRCDLGINLAGVAVVLEMLDRISEIQRENDLLRARMEL